MREGVRFVGDRSLAAPATSDPAWQVVSVDDFDGDRKSDLLWQHTQTGQLYVWFMDGTTMIGQAVLFDDPTPWRVSATGDLNGDGKTDLVWQHPATGQLYAWLLNGMTIVGEGLLAPSQMDGNGSWRIAGTADLNHDGRADWSGRTPPLAPGSTGRWTDWSRRQADRSHQAQRAQLDSSGRRGLRP